MNRKHYLLLLSLLLCLTVGTVWAEDNTIGIRVNGELLSQELPAIVIDGRTMVPTRLVSQALGAQVGWNQEYEIVIVRTADFETDLPIDTPANAVKGEGVQLEINGELVPANIITIDGRTYVPFRLIGELLGAVVEWDEVNNEVKLTLANEDANDTGAILELLMKSTEKQLEAANYTFMGRAVTNMMLPIDNDPVQLTIDMDMSGAVVMPQEMFFEMSMYVNGLPEEEEALLPALSEFEFYLNGDTLYTRLPSKQWLKQELDESFDMNAILDQYDPSLSVKMLQDAAFELYMEDIDEDDEGKSFHWIVIQLQGAKLYEAVKPMLEQMGLGTELGIDQVEMDLMVEELMNSLWAECIYWINAETFETERMSMFMTMELPVETVICPVTMLVEATYEYNTDAQMPEIAPDMIVDMSLLEELMLEM